MSDFQDSDDEKIFVPRFRILYVTVTIWFLLYVIRLWQLQILSGYELREFSEKNLLKETRIPAPRGLFFDRNGEVLVENLPGFEVTISPQYTEDLKATAAAVAPIVEMKTKDIIKKVKKSRRQNGPFYPARIKENLSRDEVFRLKQLRLDHSGLDIREVIVRSYPLQENGAHVLGYVGEISKKELPNLNSSGSHLYRQGDIIGKNGLEEAFEKYIHGVSGISFSQVDARGRQTSKQSNTIFGQKVKDEEASPGNNLHLTIDKDIQIAAYKSFGEQDRVGALVAVKPTGEVLAWVNRPSFNPNVFSTGISPEIWKQLINDPDKPLVNKVIRDHYSPGSTFKPFVALAAVQEKAVVPNEKQYSPGSIRFGRRTYHDHLRGGHGNINMYQAIERSSNIFFYRLGISLGIDKMHDYISLLGIGQKTGIELKGEVPGLLPSAKWKLKARGEVWQPGENLITSIGQGFVLSTPLQMAMAYATVANKGKRYRPFIVQKVESYDGNVVFEQSPSLVQDLTEPDNEGRFISEKAFEHVKKGLWRVGNGDRGTARWWKIPGVEISGKTGTTQVKSFSADKIYNKCEKLPREQRHHGWYVGYAPAENPEIVVSILAEHACHGSTGGAPIVRDVIRAYFEKYHPDIIKKGEAEQRRKWREARKRKLAEKQKKETEE